MPGLLQQQMNKSKTKGLAVCITQTASPFGSLNNFSYKFFSKFLEHFMSGRCSFVL